MQICFDVIDHSEFWHDSSPPYESCQNSTMFFLFIWRRRVSFSGGAFLRVKRRVSSGGGGAFLRVGEACLRRGRCGECMADLLDFRDSAPRFKAAAGAEMSQSRTAGGHPQLLFIQLSLLVRRIDHAPRETPLQLKKRLRSTQHASSRGTKKSVTSSNFGTIYLP